ncbi:MAG: FadR/GntR family transcriptional regulator [Thermodesulfobacteriota bacterium]
MKNAFRPIRQPRMSREVLKQIKEAILSGRFRPGDKLPTERELTEEFQVSRAVVREALGSLVTTGFITVRHGQGGGAYVLSPGLNHLVQSHLDLFLAGQLSVTELVEARLLIEPEVARLAAYRITPETSAALAEVITAEKVPTTVHAQWVERNIAIDFALARMCGNRFYQAILEPILVVTREIVLKVKPPRVMIHEHSEHEAIVKAVQAGDGEAAAQAMRRHLARIGQALTELEANYRKKGSSPNWLVFLGSKG